MAEFLEKKIDTYAEFIAATIQHNIFIDSVPVNIHQWLDEFDDAAINPAWATLISGSGSITEANDKIALHRTAVAATANLYSDFYLPATYDILMRYKFTIPPLVVTVFSSLLPTGAYLDPIWIHIHLGVFRITYMDVGGVTRYYWNGVAWQVAVIGCPGNDDGYLRIKKTATQYIITSYDNVGTQLTQAIIAIALVYADNDIFCTGNNNGSAEFDMDIYWIAGVVNDKKAIGRFTNIIDLEQSPINKGVYSDAIDTKHLYDETIPEYERDTLFGLREFGISEKFSQGFQITKDGIIDKVRIITQKAGTIALGKKIWVEIWTDNGSGYPSTLIESYVSIKIEANNIPALINKELVFYFNTSKILNKNTQYHLVLVGDYVIDGVNTIYIGYMAAGTYPKGKPRNWDGLIWSNSAFADNYDMVFGIHLLNSSLITRFIQYVDWIAWKTLTSKVDFEGYNQVAFQIDTATKPGYVLLEDTGGGVYQVTGYNQNDIDLGQVPTDPVTLSATYKTPESTAITFEVSHSDDGIAYSALAAYVLTAGKADLTAEGLHRYWRVRVTLTTTNTARTPELDSWTIDAFEPIEELTERTLLEIFRYMKIEINFESNSCMDSGVLSYLEAKYRIAYELYIKKVKYKISGGGIIADMGLSSK